MSGVHLSHLVSWSDLVDHCTIYHDPGIKLPTGECGRVHPINKKTKLQVDQRKFLSNKVCNDPDCKTTGHKIFRKNKKKSISIPRDLIPPHIPDGSSLSRFIDQFTKAIQEFAQTERQKVQRSALEAADVEHVIKKLKDQGKWPEDESIMWHGCMCPVFSILIESGDAETLLSFSNQQIEAVLSCQHGGQAVGNNFRFLTWHVVRAYMITNLIVAADLQDKPKEWGPMRPGSTCREDLTHDCDGQTFLFFSRQYLEDDVYMKDWEAMSQLCKNCFKYLYFVEMLRQEVGNIWRGDMKGYFFGIYG